MPPAKKPTTKRASVKKSTKAQPDQKVLIAKDALSHSEHFKTFLGWVQDKMNENVLHLQNPQVIESTNRHFMVSGKIEAYDEIWDEWSKFVDNST
tara:strand:+ start:10382 stop:10666 length:285 start_codon:yes stop_codon:yes gene_type:complete